MRQNAFSLLKTMADSGNTRAQCKCASIYEEGGRGWCDPEFNLNGERSRIILNGFQIVEVDYEKAAYYYDEAIKCGNADAAYYASRMYLAGFDSLNASLKDQWKSLQYLIKGIKLGSQMCIDDNMRMYFCCDDEMINKFRQLLFENRDEEAKEYLQWLIDNGYFMENGIKFYGIWKKDK